jgi:hypothetical protein
VKYSKQMAKQSRRKESKISKIIVLRATFRCYAISLRQPESFWMGSRQLVAFDENGLGF